MSSDEKVIAASCVFCEKVGHSLPECRKIIKKTITERVKFIQEKNLCFGCLKWGHRSKHCGDRNICKTCEKRHPTCLHDNRTKEERMHARTDGARDHDKSKEGKPNQLQDQPLYPDKWCLVKKINPSQRTDLGWSVVGYDNPYLNYGDTIGVSHQVIVKQVMPGLQSSSTLTSEVHYVCRTQIKEVILPADVIKKDRPNLPDNKGCAIHRLKCLERKLRRDEQYNKDYKTFMQETITHGDAERVPQEDIHKSPACKKVLATIPKEECAQAATDKDMALGELQMERALSVQWCMASDEFQFRVVIKENPLTHSFFNL
ncbi:hypothetical protein AOLI_G00227580 [Acnodon oligacanthus]